MTDEAGEAFAGLTRRGGAGGRRRRARGRGRAARRASPTPTRSPTRTARASAIEPLISLQWFMRMDELARPAIDGGARRRVRFHPERWARGLPRLDGEHPAVVRLAPAVVGPPPAGLLLRRLRGDLRRARRRRSAAGPATGRCARTTTCSTRGSRARCGRSRRSAGRRRPRSCAPSTRPTSLVTARDIIFLWVARMMMMGLEFTGEVPFRDVYVHSVIQAPDGRRMSKSLGTGIDPLEEIDRSGADAVRFGMLAMSSTQDVRYSAEKIEQGERLANKLFNAARFVLPGDRRPAPAQRARRPRSRIAGSSRGWRAPSASSRARIEAYDFTRVAQRPLRVRLRRAVRLVHRARQAAARTSPTLRATLRYVLRAHADARPPDDAVRHRGALALCARGGRGPARRRSSASRRTTARSTRTPRRARVGDRARRRRCARWRDDFAVAAGRGAGGAPERRVRRGARGAAGADGAPGAARRDRRAGVASVAVPGGAVRCSRASTSRAHAERRARERAKLEAEIARAAAKLANARLRREGAAGGGRGRAREARRARAPSWRRCERAAGRGARERWSAEEAERYLLGLERFGMRFGLDRMRRLMNALELPTRALPDDARRRHQRQVLDDADDRGAPRATRACAPAASPRRICSATASGSGSASATSRRSASRRRSRGSSPRPSWSTAPRPSGRRGDPVRAADRGGALRVRAPSVDVAVLEAGLGGRYDATNVVDSRVAVLTNVGLEHTR